jgi:hypothetical protein
MPTRLLHAPSGSAAAIRSARDCGYIHRSHDGPVVPLSWSTTGPCVASPEAGRLRPGLDADGSQQVS